MKTTIQPLSLSLLTLLLAACSQWSAQPPADAQAAPATVTALPEKVAVPAAAPAPVASPDDLDELRDNAGSRPAGARQLAKMRAATVMTAAPVPAERDQFAHFQDNAPRLTANDPVSTFSLDVDTGSYALVRRFLEQGRLPPADAVRTEELLNYFPYEVPQQTAASNPFAVYSEISACPWAPGHALLRVMVQARTAQMQTLPPANLVFLVDVSGSMQDRDKLPLVVASLQMLTRSLRAQDRVSLVVYAGRTAVVLEPTSGNDKAKIAAALQQLEAGGSTAGASGLRLAYELARQAYIPNGINRVLLATDGDFNVGMTDINQLKEFVARQRTSGITLSTLGFGQGNLNDALMEQIADVGNGNYSYIDSLDEARKVLVDEMASTFQTVAQDVKLQLEFNPGVVAEYRQIGYENRQLARADFNNDRVDAGDVGAGKSVVALYELTPKGGRTLTDPLRYQATTAPAGKSGELGFLRIRYKAPGAQDSLLREQPLAVPAGWPDKLLSGSGEQRFAAAVAAFGQLLRQSPYLGNYRYVDVVRLAEGARGPDALGLRARFVRLAESAGQLQPLPPVPQ